jgi:pimeloyl-ACP methyl ester carboxylesterase
MPAPVIMVHGAFCGGWVFDRFKAPFERAGHLCLTPDLPGHGPGEGAAAVCGQSMTHYASAIVDLIDACTEPPILIGHSLGGLVAQIAATRRRVRSLILLAPSAPWGVPGGSMEEAAAVIGLMSLGAYWTQAVAPDAGIARSYSLDRMPPAEREATAARMAHESGRALWETFQWWMDPFMTTTVSPVRIKAPVLALAGGGDCIHPPAAVRQTAARLGASFRAYDGMSHWLIGEPGYEAVAEDCLSWLARAERAAA